MVENRTGALCRIIFRHSEPTPSKIRQTPLDFIAIFAGLLVLTVLATLLGWQFWHANRIFSGVQIDGVPVGGLTHVEAVNTLEGRLSDYPTPPVTLRLNTQRFPVPAEALRAQWEPIDAVNQAYLLGREGNLSTRLAQQLGLAFVGYNLVPEATYEVAPLRQALSEIANQVRSDTSLSSDGPEVGVDVEATLAAVLGKLQRPGQADLIELPMASVVLPAPEPAFAESTPLETLAGQTPEPLLFRDPIYGIETALDPEQIESIVFTQEPLKIDRRRTA